MKTKSRNLIISFLLMIAMLLGVFAISPLTASALSITPTPEETPAETVYVGGVALSKGQYVKNGETTAITGEPDWEESGFAFYASSGTFHLSDYEYEGIGYTHDTSEKSVIYSEGKLEIILHGASSIKNTADAELWSANGIRTKGNLIIDGPGTITINAPYAIYGNNLVKFEYGRTVISSATVAIEAGGNFIVNGGYVELHSTQPIYAGASFISGGSFFATAEQGVFQEAPTISVDTEDVYSLYICTDVAGNNQVAYVPENITQYKYFKVVPPTLTEINSISVSGVEVPEVGETKDVMEFTPDSLTYGGEYKMVGRGFAKYTGTEWVDVSDTESLEYGVKYRVNLVLAPNEGYAFADSITSDDVTFNGKDAEFLGFANACTAKYARIALEFSYEATATDYGITIADKDDSGATVGVLITEENCTDVLGDGTVSFDPTTSTLTLNGYKYEGEGCLVDEGGYMAIMADIPAEGLTIVLVGANSITVSGGDSAGMVFFEEGDLTIKGNGSLSINSIMYGITLQTDSGKLTTENAKLNITTTGAMAIGIQATDFVMSSGDLKITASMIGIGTSKETGICINGGSVEIGTATGGYAFIYLDFEHMTFNPVKPDLSGYFGAYKMTAGANADGSDATDFNEGYLSSYKYVKIEPAHVHDHGTAWESDANNHWKECSCGDKANVGAHNDGNSDGKCDTCDYQMANGGGTYENPDKPKDGLSGGAIAGIVVGCVAVAGIGGFSVVWFVVKKKSFADLIAIFKKR